MKIKIRFVRGFWWSFIPGPVPDFTSHWNWLDALARVQAEWYWQREERLGPRLVKTGKTTL